MKLDKKKSIVLSVAVVSALSAITLYAYAQTTPSNPPTSSVAPIPVTTQPSNIARTQPALQHSSIIPNNSGHNVIQVVSPGDINNRLNISSSGRQEVDQDYLTMTLRYTIQNKDSKIVQDTLNKEINAALAKAKTNQTTQNGKNLLIQSGQMSVFPRYEKQQLVNWVGQGTIVVEGKDFSLVSKTASEMSNLVVTNISLGLSPEKVESLKDQTVKQAISNFKIDALKFTQLFGFQNYRIKDVSVNYNNMGSPRPYTAMAMSAKSSDNMQIEAVTIEPGKSVLEANVSGTIEMFN